MVFNVMNCLHVVTAVFSFMQHVNKLCFEASTVPVEEDMGATISGYIIYKLLFSSFSTATKINCWGVC